MDRVPEADAGQGPVRLRPGQAAELPGGPAPAAAVRRRQRRAEAGARAAQGERERRRRRTSRSSRRTRSRSRVSRRNAQAIYAVLDAAMSGVLTEPEREHRRAAQDGRRQGQPAPRRRELIRRCGGRRAGPHTIRAAPSASPTQAGVAMAITPSRGPARAPGRPASPYPAGPQRTSLGRKVRDNLTGHAFLIGAVLCFALFSWYPMIRGVVMSFQRTRRGVTTWVGWDNYERIIADPSFWTAWKNTFYFTVLALRTRVRGAVLRGDPAQRVPPRQGVPADPGLPAGDAAASLGAVPLQVLRVRPERRGPVQLDPQGAAPADIAVDAVARR